MKGAFVSGDRTLVGDSLVAATVRRAATGVALLWLGAAILASLLGFQIPLVLRAIGKIGIVIRVLMYAADVAYAMRTQPFGRALVSAIPPSLVRFTLGELSVYRAFFTSLVRQPITPAGHRFIRAPKYRTLLILMVLSAVLEVPVFFIIVRHILPEGTHLLVDLFTAAGALYLLVLMRADWFAINSTSHRVDSDALLLRLGTRCRGDIPLCKIASVERLPRGGPPRISRDRLRVVRVTPADKPNVLVRMHEPGMWVAHWLRGCLYSSELAIYVDDPSSFVSDMDQAMDRSADNKGAAVDEERCGGL